MEINIKGIKKKELIELEVGDYFIRDIDTLGVVIEKPSVNKSGMRVLLLDDTAIIVDTCLAYDWGLNTLVTPVRITNINVEIRDE